MSNLRRPTYSLSHVTEPPSVDTHNHVNMVIKKPNTNQDDIEIQLPLAINETGEVTSGSRSSVEYMLTYHEIPQPDAVRMSQTVVQYVRYLRLSRAASDVSGIYIYFEVTDYSSEATIRLDVDVLIADLQTTVRPPLPAEEIEDCAICLERLRGTADINDL